MAQRARDLNNEVYDDLQYAERAYTALSKHWVIEHEVYDGKLPSLLATMTAAILDYTNWASTVMQEKWAARDVNPKTFEELTWYRTVDIFHQD